MRYDLIFITTALLCLLVGEGLGIYMGINAELPARRRRMRT